MNLHANLKLPLLLIMIYLSMNANIYAKLEKIDSNKINSISVIPLILGGDDDPFLDGVKTLSFKGYGELKGKKAEFFWNGFNEKVNFAGYLDNGIQFDLLVLLKDNTYRRVRLRMTKKSLIYIKHVEGTEGAYYRLPESSYKIFRSCLIQ